MKKIIVAFCFTVGCVIPSFAQQVASKKVNDHVRLTPAQRATLQTEAMQQDLKLTPAQVQRVQEINLEAAKETQQLQKNRQAAKQQIQKVNEHKMQQYQRVLTPAQMSKYQKGSSAAQPVVQ